MKIKEIHPNLYHIKFKSQYEETSTFIRLQEFYESAFPEIKGKYFTLEEYMDRYAEFKGNFTYFSDWSGFNVPGDVILAFQDLFEYQRWELREKEMGLLSLLEITIKNYKTGKFYIIGTYKDSDISHEIAHGLFYLNKNYKKVMENLIKRKRTSKTIKTIKNRLLKMGYCKEVLNDEVQAYLATESLDNINDENLIKEFNKIYKRYTRRIK